MTESIERILEALAPYLKSELSGLGYSPHSPDRDDLLQEIRIRIWKALENKGGNIQYINAYVKKIVFSVFINEVNRLRRERQLIGVAENELCLDNPVKSDCAISANVMKEKIIESLMALGGTKRRVIELRMEGFTFAEIALINHWSLRKACNAYYRGIGELKRSLAKKGICYED